MGDWSKRKSARGCDDVRARPNDSLDGGRELLESVCLLLGGGVVNGGRRQDVSRGAGTLDPTD